MRDERVDKAKALILCFLDMRVRGVLHRRTIPVRFQKLLCFEAQARRTTALGKACTHLVTEETTELELESRIESIARAAEVAAQVVGRLGLGEEAAFGVDMAVREAVTNAVLHGNKQDAAKKVEVRFRGSREMLEITVRDRGAGFNLDNVPDPTDPQNLMKASGRGILFMRSFMDDVEYSRHPEGGTVVRMTKRK
jgi:serine/threonine-protein kinase RsbW